MAAKNTVEVSPFHIITWRKPKRRSIGCATPFISKAPALLVKVISPLCSADMPNPSCNIIGRRNGTDPAAIRVRPPPITDRPNVGTFISEKSSTGCATSLLCRRYIHPLSRPAATMAAVTGAEVSPRVAISSPNIRQDSETPDSSSPQPSKSTRPSSLMSRM